MKTTHKIQGSSSFSPDDLESQSSVRRYPASTPRELVRISCHRQYHQFPPFLFFPEVYSLFHPLSAQLPTLLRYLFGTNPRANSKASHTIPMIRNSIQYWGQHMVMRKNVRKWVTAHPSRKGRTSMPIGSRNLYLHRAHPKKKMTKVVTIAMTTKYHTELSWFILNQVKGIFGSCKRSTAPCTTTTRSERCRRQ